MNEIRVIKDLYQQGNLGKAFQEAYTLFHRKAVSLTDKAEALQIMGLIFLHQDNYLDAEVAFKKSCQIDAENPKYQHSLGVTYLMSRRYPQATAAFFDLHSKDPSNAEYWSSYVTALAESGQLDSVWKEFEKLWKAYPKNEKVYYAYCRYLTYIFPIGEWHEYWPAADHDKIIPEMLRPALLTLRIADAFIRQDTKKIKLYLKLLKQQLNLFNGKDIEVGNLAIANQYKSNLLNAQGYYSFMSKLIEYAPLKREEEVRQAYIVGDSHSLSPYRQFISIKKEKFQIQSRLVMGVKAWHLARRENSVQRAALKRELESLPEGAACIVSVGEIDTRDDEGIWDVVQRKGKDIEETLAKTFPPAVEWLAKYGKNLRLVVCGLPMPPQARIDRKLKGKAKEYESFIEQANKLWVESLLDKGVAVLDINAMTKNQDWHIDTIHLKPDALAYAFEKYLIKPKSWK